MNNKKKVVKVEKRGGRLEKGLCLLEDGRYKNEEITEKAVTVLLGVLLLFTQPF